MPVKKKVAKTIELDLPTQSAKTLVEFKKDLEQLVGDVEVQLSQDMIQNILAPKKVSPAKTQKAKIQAKPLDTTPQTAEVPAAESKPQVIAPPPPFTAEELEGEQVFTPLTSDLWAKAELAGCQGYPLMLGGDDFEGAIAVVYVYHDPKHKGKKHYVIHATVKRSAEEKLRTLWDATSGYKTEIQFVDEPYTGRAKFDTDHSIGEELASWARSINHRCKLIEKGEPWQHKPNYMEGIPKFMHLLTEIVSTKTYQGVPLSDGEVDLAKQYLDDVLDLMNTKELMDKYPQGGPPGLKEFRTFYHKIGPHAIRKDFGVRQGTFIRKKKVEVKVPINPGPIGVVTQERNATRIAVSVGTNGKPCWDGVSRNEASGKELYFDFKDGWYAVYRPYQEKYGIVESQKGDLELVRPNVTEDVSPHDIVEHFRRIYLNGAPLTHAQVEVAYLEANVESLGIIQHAKYKQASNHYRQIQQGIQNLLQFVAFDIAAQGKYPPDATGVVAIINEAERQVAPQRIAEMRHLFENVLKLGEGELAKLPQYDPTPIYDMGHYFFRRFDLNEEKVKKLMNGYVIGHSLTGKGAKNLEKIILTGALMAQEKRRQAGVNQLAGATMSPNADQETGGALFLFCRIGNPGEFDIEWGWPAMYHLLSRTDWFWRPHDKYGNAKKDEEGKYEVKIVTDLEEIIQKIGHGNNEFTFRYGIGLTGPFAPTKIRASKYGKRDAVLNAYKQLGITHLHGIPIEDVVT